MAETSTDFDPARAMATAVELRLVMGQLIRRLREETHPGDFTLSQLSVVGRLERDGPATVTGLAKAEGMRSQSMGAILAALEAAGMVSGAPDPADGRQTLLSITPTCRELLMTRRAAREDWLLAAIGRKLTLREQNALAEAVGLLKRLAEA